jgi:CD80-like C2-set immunoglobulin domain
MTSNLTYIPDSVTIDESNGLFSVKTVYSLVLSRQELGTFIECRVESPALESVVSNQIHLDLQGEWIILNELST